MKKEATTKRVPKVVRLPGAKVPRDDRMTQTLIWVLEQARAGKVRGFSLICGIELSSGAMRYIESNCPFRDEDAHTVLGMMRKAEVNFIRREWPNGG